jgi:RNA polymerase sigma-70 factor (ECF subfamily)
MTSDEADLVRRFQACEPDSFDNLYAAFGGRVYRFCRRLTSTAADAEDLTQEVFVAAYTGRERFAGRSSITTWLLRIAVFRWRATRRKRRIETVALTDRDGVDGHGHDPVAGEVNRLALAHALDSLPLEQREAFLLVRAEGLTCREAADVLGVPEGTLKFRVYRAVERLRLTLNGDAEAIPLVPKSGKGSRHEA